jgi:hypothetical protein
MEKVLFFEVLSIVSRWVELRIRENDIDLTHADWTTILGGWLIDGPISSSLSTEGFLARDLSSVSSHVVWIDYASTFDWDAAIAAIA